ncbi:MAG: hypothetical protein LLF83_03835 [Methanobacterium sp.]|nr:hypothetical protein [Methanobacterium sp.]
MDTSIRTFAVRDVSRVLIAFGIIILVLNLNHYLIIYIFGIFTLIIGVLNLFSLNPQLKLIGAINMIFVAIYLILSSIILYNHIYGLLGIMVMVALSLLLSALSVRYIIYHIQN